MVAVRRQNWWDLEAEGVREMEEPRMMPRFPI